MDELDDLIDSIENRIKKQIVKLPSSAAFDKILVHLKCTRKKFFKKLFATTWDAVSLGDTISIPNSLGFVEFALKAFPKLNEVSLEEEEAEEFGKYINAYVVIMVVEISPLLDEIKTDENTGLLLKSIPQLLERYNKDAEIIAGIKPVEDRTIEFIKERIESPPITGEINLQQIDTINTPPQADAKSKKHHILEVIYWIAGIAGGVAAVITVIALLLKK